jgi:hypothetical protein
MLVFGKATEPALNTAAGDFDGVIGGEVDCELQPAVETAKERVNQKTSEV